MTLGRGPRAAVAALALAVPYLPIAAGSSLGGNLGGAVIVGAAALGAPGAVGLLWGGGPGAARRFVHALLAIGLLNVAAVVGLKLVGISPTAPSFAAALGVLTVATGGAAAARGGTLPRFRSQPFAVVVAVVGCGLAWLAGTRVVPPLEDQDMEVQGTAWGLAHDLEPVCLTNRSTLHFFAHPLLLHALNASTLTLAGELPVVRPAYDAAVAAREVSPPDGSRGIVAAWLALWAPETRVDRSFEWFHEVYKPFLKEPALLGTRTPNWVLAGAVALLLFAAARNVGAGAGDALLVTVTYATLPEIFVRSGYGGYYVLTAATMLAGASLAAGEHGGGRSGYVAGAAAILSNQKALVIATAVAAFRAVIAIVRGSARRLAPAVPFVLGVVAGGAVFWVYGLAIAPDDFVADHLLDHVLRRFAGGEVTSRAGDAVYASRPGIWLEFARHMGWGWVALAAAGLTLGVRQTWREVAVATADSPRGSLVAILTLWAIVGAVVFTATDWRQTKHLCLIVPALSVLIAALFAAGVPRSRVVLRAALGLALAWNVRGLARLATDFDSLSVTPIW